MIDSILLTAARGFTFKGEQRLARHSITRVACTMISPGILMPSAFAVR